jgi:transposase-like protein
MSDEMKSCPHCGQDMIHKPAVVGLPAHWACAKCGYTCPVYGDRPVESRKGGKRTLFD